MSTKNNTPLVVIGQIETLKFKAEVYPKQRIIICMSEPLGGLLPNNDIEQRAEFIARQLLRHCIVVVPKLWLYVEVQTCFDGPSFKKITGLTRTNQGHTASYENLTHKEWARIKPLVESLREQVKLCLTAGTPSPNENR